MLLGAAGVGGTISLFDSRLALGARRLGGDDMRTPSSIGSFVGGPVPLALGATLYVVGRGTGRQLRHEAGREVIRAVLVSGAITARRLRARWGALALLPRPVIRTSSAPAADSERLTRVVPIGAHERGVRDRHGARARAACRRTSKPGGWLDSLLFGGATFVGFSRVYDQQHWPSDVVAGAALGSITGYEVVAHAHGDRSRDQSAVCSRTLRWRRVRMAWSVAWSPR